MSWPSESMMTPTVSVTTVSNGNEATGDPVLFSFERTGDLAEQLIVKYTLKGTAVSGDYRGASRGIVTIPAGSSTAILALPVLNDSQRDPAETVIASIDLSSNYSVSPPNLAGSLAEVGYSALAMITADGIISRPVRMRHEVIASGHEFQNSRSFAILRKNGTVACWGDSEFGGVAPQGLTDVIQIFSNKGAYAALKADGTVTCWGSPLYGGIAPDTLRDVTKVFSTSTAFAALKHDGSVLCWGDSGRGGITPEGLANVINIFSAESSFIALKEDGSATHWGRKA